MRAVLNSLPRTTRPNPCSGRLGRRLPAGGRCRSASHRGGTGWERPGQAAGEHGCCREASPLPARWARPLQVWGADGRVGWTAAPPHKCAGRGAAAQPGSAQHRMFQPAAFSKHSRPPNQISLNQPQPPCFLPYSGHKTPGCTTAGMPMLPMLLAPGRPPPPPSTPPQERWAKPPTRSTTCVARTPRHLPHPPPCRRARGRCGSRRRLPGAGASAGCADAAEGRGAAAAGGLHRG